MKTSKNTPEQIDREAADWVVRWEDRERTAAPKEQSRWFGWLQRSPQHVQAYFDTAELYERLGGMDPQGRIDVDEWLAERRTPVISIATHRKTPEPSSRYPEGMRWALAAAAVVSTCGIALWLWQAQGRPTYRTDVGQQSVYRLADGSVMNLNTRSSAQVRFSNEQRLIELDGEGLFTVAHDAARPFYVRTRDATVRAVGTKFNVYEQADVTRVAVVEGVVQVTPGAQSAGTSATVISLSAGDTARISDGRVALQKAPNVKAAVAWQHQQLVFEDASLAEVAAEFNRYNDSQIRVEPSLGRDYRLSGTFDALHPQSLLLYLRKDAALSVNPSGEDFKVAPRSKSTPR